MGGASASRPRMTAIEPVTAAALAGDPDLRAQVLALNNAHAVELSLLDATRLLDLVGEAFLAARIGRLDALMLAFDQRANYDSPNFLWLRERFDRFVYVDRVVTAPHARGRGLARALYAHLFDVARVAGHVRIVCEVNADPPNPASDAFHSALGFAPVGSAVLANGKTVSYLARPL